MKKKILHVIGNMDRGGAESWIMNLLRSIDHDSYEFHFMTHSDKSGAFDSEIEKLGGRIYNNDNLSNPIKYAHKFWEITQENGPWDVVHSHVYTYSGYVLFIAKLLGVKKRIAHSHNSNSYNSGGVVRDSYNIVMKFLIREFSTFKIGCSEVAYENLFDRPINDDTDGDIVYCGINPDEYELTPEEVRLNKNYCECLKQEFKMTERSIILGHVGSFTYQKNHVGLIEIFERAYNNNKDLYLLLIGVGPLEQEIKNLVKDKDLKNVLFLGARDDVSKLMNGLFDMFLLPSHYEGLPLVLMEAQGANLPCIVSDSVTSEVELPAAKIAFLPSRDLDIWEDKIKEYSELGNYGLEKENIIKNSIFDIKNSWNQLAYIY